jgi:hypothetical protein
MPWPTIPPAAEPLPRAPEAQPFPAEGDIDAVLYEFKGEAREAIRALLHARDQPRRPAAWPWPLS